MNGDLLAVRVRRVHNEAIGAGRIRVGGIICALSIVGPEEIRSVGS